MTQVLLDDAEAMLERKIPDLLDKAAKDDSYRRAVIMVEAMMVCRVLRNPGGYRSESEGDYSYTTDTRAASGFLTVLDSEWQMLGASSDGAFTITPGFPGGTGIPWYDYPPWYFQYATPGEPHYVHWSRTPRGER